jgi:F-type H+-transporting ATPase subunit a
MSWAIRLGFLPFNIVEEIQKPVSLALRLFGNIFAGVLMVYLLAQLPIVISWFPIAVWKAFDVFFVGTIQAFIFMLLTLIYFAQAREGLEEESHGAEAVATSQSH